jgi:ADP-ribose/FAD diphosphatase
MRETKEEINARVDIMLPYFHLDIPVIGQSYLLFRTNLAPPYTFGCGPETPEAQLFAPEDIPFADVIMRQQPAKYTDPFLLFL